MRTTERWVTAAMLAGVLVSCASSKASPERMVVVFDGTAVQRAEFLSLLDVTLSATASRIPFVDTTIVQVCNGPNIVHRAQLQGKSHAQAILRSLAPRLLKSCQRGSQITAGLTLALQEVAHQGPAMVVVLTDGGLVDDPDSGSLSEVTSQMLEEKMVVVAGGLLGFNNLRGNFNQRFVALQENQQYFSGGIQDFSAALLQGIEQFNGGGL